MPSVKLVSMSQPMIEGLQTPEELIVFIARVSNPANQATMTTSAKLISYLIKNNHWSPFEQVSISLEIETTRDIARQMLRHRSFVFQEFSQRYADPTKELGFEYREARMQDLKNRQNSIPIEHFDGDRAQILADNWDERQKEVIRHAKDAYEWAIKSGIAKEQARVVLPEGLTISRLYMTGNLRNWIHYCQLRMGNGTQKEHSVIADMCWNEIGKHFPNVVEALNL